MPDAIDGHKYLRNREGGHLLEPRSHKFELIFSFRIFITKINGLGERGKKKSKTVSDTQGKEKASGEEVSFVRITGRMPVIQRNSPQIGLLYL